MAVARVRIDDGERAHDRAFGVLSHGRIGECDVGGAFIHISDLQRDALGMGRAAAVSGLDLMIL